MMFSMPSEIKQLIIYYFSGTGNARNVARWIAGVAVERNIPTEVIDIAMIDRKHIPVPPAGVMIGFVSPTHGFNYPPVSIYFIFRFPRSNRARYSGS